MIAVAAVDVFQIILQNLLQSVAFTRHESYLSHSVRRAMFIAAE